jgi:hypothetical protein
LDCCLISLNLDSCLSALVDESKALHAEWEKQFGPVAMDYLHPVWQKSRPAFRALMQNGLPGDFLKNARRKSTSVITCAPGPRTYGTWSEAIPFRGEFPADRVPGVPC